MAEPHKTLQIALPKSLTDVHNGTFDDENPPEKGTNLWLINLAVDIGYDILSEGALCERYAITKRELDEIVSGEDFRELVAEYKRFLNESGDVLKEKYRYSLEAILPTLVKLIGSGSTSDTGRLGMMEKMMEIAGYKGGGAAGGAGVAQIPSLVIGFGSYMVPGSQDAIGPVDVVPIEEENA